MTFSRVRKFGRKSGKIADRFILPGMHMLDLGCGTGDDAVHFARRSVRVTAVDVSPAMIARLKLKCDQMIHCEEADMRTYCPGGLRFDSVFSNLSALNYVSDLSWLSRLCLSAGSHVVLTTLGRFYPLESLIFLAKGKPRLAFHRFGRLAKRSLTACISISTITASARFRTHSGRNLS